MFSSSPAFQSQRRYTGFNLLQSFAIKANYTWHSVTCGIGYSTLITLSINSFEISFQVKRKKELLKECLQEVVHLILKPLAVHDVTEKVTFTAVFDLP